MLIKCPIFNCCLGDKPCPPGFDGLECYRIVKGRKPKKGVKVDKRQGPRFNS